MRVCGNKHAENFLKMLYTRIYKIFLKGWGRKNGHPVNMIIDQNIYFLLWFRLLGRKTLVDSLNPQILTEIG